MNLAALRETFAIEDELEITLGRGNFPMLYIHNQHARATVSLYGGQVLSYRPHGAEEDIFFLSEQAYFEPGEAIKGGVPICWPWFGPEPENLGRPDHGFARTQMWMLQETAQNEDGSTRILLSLTDNEQTRNQWPYAFRLALDIQVGNSLRISLHTHNQDERPFPITQALHSYFFTWEADQVEVLGLDSCTYLDKTQDYQASTQQGAVNFEGEIDRIYQQVPPTLKLHDPRFHRTLELHSSGSQTAVVWNPGEIVAAPMLDLDSYDYKRFVCVETANAADEVITLEPGEAHQLGVEIKLV